MKWKNVKIADMFKKLTKKANVNMPDTEAMLTSFASYTDKIAKNLNTVIGGYEKMAELGQSTIDKTQETADKINDTLTDLLNDLSGTGMKIVNPSLVVGNNETYYNKLKILIDNDTDPNRPNYSANAYIGCILIFAGAPNIGAPQALINKVKKLQGSWV